METQIVRVEPPQAGLLGRVAEDVFDDAIDPARLAAYLAEPGHLMVLAMAAGEVVGQARGVVHRQPDQPTELYIDNLGVTPVRRRERLATRMLDELTAWSRELGCEAAWVATETDNGPARALYEGRGSEAETFVMYFYGFADPAWKPRPSRGERGFRPPPRTRRCPRGAAGSVRAAGTSP